MLSLADLESDIVGCLATVTVVFILFIYGAVIISAFNRAAPTRDPTPTEPNTPVGRHRRQRGPAGVCHQRRRRLVAVGRGSDRSGFVLFLAEYLFGKRNRPPGAKRGDPATLDGEV